MTRRIPRNRAQRSLRRPARERYATRRVGFDSGGERCRGTLYLPDRPDDPPIVVMAPGFGAGATFGYPAVAERFAEAGIAALLFDYRCHGDSDGEPRRLVSPRRQLADYAAAIDRARDVPGVDGGRLGVWGHSLSGGHALVVAAGRYEVDAAVAVAPFADGRAFLRARPPGHVARAVAAGLRDRARALGGRLRSGSHPREVPIVGEPGELAVVSAPGAKRAYLDLVDRDSAWQNRTPARCLLDLARYRPGERAAAGDLEAFVLVPSADAVVPPATMLRAAGGLSDATVVRTAADHYSVLGEDLDETVGYQLAFLRRALRADA